jgi:hypothetical protein
MVVGALASSSAAALAADPVLPHYDHAQHLGVASCASSTCHGAAVPVDGGVVQQNEFAIWQNRDKHAVAYEVLGNDLSRRIAANLGIGDAREAGICLDCHADNVPPERRGPQFQLSDGVGCESCHGGASNWIQVHKISDNQNGHARNLQAGLYPTEDPKARARLCLSCHLGDRTKLVTHRIMGAGHPRLSFELDTFTAIEPAHFTVDADYEQRKQLSNGIQTWAVGQAMMLSETMGLLLDTKRNRDAVFPELTFFDCHACHKPMSAGTWRERESLGLGPGVVRLNDASLIMVRVIADAIAPSLGKQIAAQGKALHRASQADHASFEKAARALKASADRAVDVFAGYKFGAESARAILRQLVAESRKGETVDYVAAEQTTMAIGAILAAMRQADWISEQDFAANQQVMDQLYQAVEQDERYRPARHQAGIVRLKGLSTQ